MSSSCIPTVVSLTGWVLGKTVGNVGGVGDAFALGASGVDGTELTVRLNLHEVHRRAPL